MRKLYAVLELPFMPNWSHVLARTPSWVFALFVSLLAVGIRQMRDRQVSLGRLTVMPLAMVTFSLYGVGSDFGVRPIPIAAWATTVLFVMCLMLRWSAPVAVVDTETGLVHVPGSAIPLVLMMAIFALRYIAAVALTMKPELREESLAGAALYGALTGLFAGRDLGLVRRHVLRAPADARKSLGGQS
jgi:hypothetical protein